MIPMDTAILVMLEILNSATILVLLALGLAIVFGMMRIVNLAQGEFFTIGAFTTLAADRFAGLPLGIAMLLAPCVAGVVGIVIERLVILGSEGEIEASHLPEALRGAPAASPSHSARSSSVA